jgi:hypothetical protein
MQRMVYLVYIEIAMQKIREKSRSEVSH